VSDVAAVLEREFPGRDVASATPARRGNTKETTLVAFGDGGGAVVQFAADAAAFRTELALSRAVRERTAVPTPRVLAAGRLDGRAYAVVERVAGDDLHERFSRVDDGTRTRLARRFGRFLAGLHEAFAFESYGRVRVAGDGAPPGDDRWFDGGEATEFAVAEPAERTDESPTRSTEAPWPAWFRAYARAGVDALPPAFDGLRPDLDAALETAALPASPPSALYPWDLRPGNAVFDGEAVTAVLDWGGPLAAPPGLSVAKTEHLVADWYVEDGGSLRDAFRDGYASLRPYPDVPPVYRLAAVVRSAVDSRGEVTRPRYPELHGERAVRFHRERMREWL
jgi:hypothetical protein